ncbi:PKH2 [Symbiodinium sp. CCMP2592]|nr:PKH2 [Symbiodinium sp. CCMP2592]
MVPRRVSGKRAPEHVLEPEQPEDAAFGVKRRPAKRTENLAAAAVRSMAPSKRTAYALHVQHEYPRQKESLFPGRGKLKQREHRQVISEIGRLWHELSNDEKALYEGDASAESQHRKEVIQSLQVPEEQLACAAPTLGDAIRIGSWEFIGKEPLATGRSSSLYLVQHSILKKHAQAAVYLQKDDLQEELRGLKILSNIFAENPEVDWMEALYMVPLYFLVDGPTPCIVHEHLPSLHGYGAMGDNSRLMRDVAEQMATSLKFLHEHGVLHLDIRPKSWFFSVSENITKLGNFHAAILEAEATNLKFHPYATGYRPPELHCALHDAVATRHAEAWALGASLAHIASGEPPFQTLAAILKFQAQAKTAKRHEAASNPALKLLRDPVQLALLRLLSPEDQRLSVSEWLEQKQFSVFLLEP